MSGALYAAGILVIVLGGVIGAILYAKQDSTDDDPDADADAVDTETVADDAPPVEDDDTDDDAGKGFGQTLADELRERTRPQREESALGKALAKAITSIPEAEKGPRATLRDRLAETGRPSKPYSLPGRVLAGIIATIPKPLLGVRETMFKRLAVKSIENYHKTAGGDAIAINAQAGQQLDLEPVQYRPPEACEDEQTPGWAVKGRDKTWHPAKEGNSVNYLGKTPVVALEDDAHVEAGWLAPRVGEAIEMDNYWPLFTNPEITAHVNAGGAAANTAIADGGTGAMQFELEDFGAYADDAIVDLDSGPGHDGMRISMSKAREWQAETVSSEQMQMQEERGRLIGMLGGDGAPSAFKLLLVAGAIVLGSLFIIEVLPILLSEGGGGGGGINPLMLALGGL